MVGGNFSFSMGDYGIVGVNFDLVLLIFMGLGREYLVSGVI